MSYLTGPKLCTKSIRLSTVQLTFFRKIVRSVMDNNCKSHSSSAEVSDFFASDNITEKYAQFRPSYNPETYEVIKKFCRESRSELEFAVDVGCGSGQSSLPLLNICRKVIGVDVSQNQIAHAPSDVPGLSFQHSEGEDLSFIPNESVDLVTVAQAFHWFDEEKFYQEADRVLKPGGSLVVYGYGNFVLDKEEAQAYISKIYTDVLGKYWAEGNKMIESKYSSVKLPYAGWRRDDSLLLVKDWNVTQLVGYLASWSSVDKLLKENPQSLILNDLHSELSKIYGDTSPKGDSVQMKVSWPIFILMGHKPL